MSLTEATSRLFFAIPCPEAVRLGIDSWRRDRRFPGAHVPATNLHITLEFLGEVPLSKLPALQDAASAVQPSFCPFNLSLNKLGRWRNGILHLSAANRDCGPLVNLQAALRGALLDPRRELGLRLDRREWNPHLTLARDVPFLPHHVMKPKSFSWLVGSFVLLRSDQTDTGVAYTVLEEWRLEEGQQAGGK